METGKFKIESGVQLFTRLTKKNFEKFYPILFSTGPNQGDIIEFFGSDPSPSLLLIDVICEALIPSNLNGVDAGVLIFKTDGKLNVEELINIIREKLISRIGNNNIELDSLLHNALNNLFVLEVYDATQFYTTIHNLDNILLENRNISLVIFDTLTAFYWSEQGFKITKMDFYVKNVLRIIHNITKEYKIICIYTRPEYFSSNKDSDNLQTNELHITEMVKYRIQVLGKDNTGAYQVNVRTRDTYFEKYFIINAHQIKWQ